MVVQVLCTRCGTVEVDTEPGAEREMAGWDHVLDAHRDSVKDLLVVVGTH